VSYGDASLAARAQVVLDAAITSYQVQVETWGFWPPGIEPGAGLYRFYLEDAEGAAGYTAPYAYDESTPREDAFTYIVIEASLDEASLRTTTAHELNHACQTAMDVGEVVAFMENTATWIEAMTFPEAAQFLPYVFPYFQEQPHRPLEYMRMNGSDIYEYGGALWVHFLETLYGAGDPAWIRSIWEACVQNLGINEPDYLDAIDERLAEVGGLAEAVRTFARYRFFIGGDDDGQHLPGAGEWYGAEVARAATWSTSNLPVIDAGPASLATRPQPNGCNYVVLEVSTRPELPLKVTFAGDPALRWNVDLLQVAAGAPTTVTRVNPAEEASAAVTVDASALDRLVLVICQLGAPGYDPDPRHWTAGDYRYRLEPDVPAPEVTAVTPDTLAQGAPDGTLLLAGARFSTLPGLAVRTAPADVILRLEAVVSDTELRVTAFVPPGAALGPRDVVVTNPGGREGVAPAALTIVAPGADAGPDAGGGTGGGGEGCGCAAGGSRSAPAPLVVALFSLWIIRRRRS
jgi:hypothetical protein